MKIDTMAAVLQAGKRKNAIFRFTISHIKKGADNICNAWSASMQTVYSR